MSHATLAIAPDGAFSGHAAIFAKADLGGDVIQPGAFAQSLARGPAKLRLLFMHDPKEPIGLIELAREDTRGLFVRGPLLPGVQRAREVHALVSAGALDGLSIGFKTLRSRRDPRTGLRLLQAVDLWEISLVTFPMMPEARLLRIWTPELIGKKFDPDQPRDKFGKWTAGGVQLAQNRGGGPGTRSRRSKDDSEGRQPDGRPDQRNYNPAADMARFLAARPTTPEARARRGIDDIIAPGGQVVGYRAGRAEPHITTVRDNLFNMIRDDLIEGARLISGPGGERQYADYGRGQGRVYERIHIRGGEQIREVFGVRRSDGSGQTIDLFGRGTVGAIQKIHRSDR